MSAPADSAGATGVARTWPLPAAAASVTVTPLPADDAAAPVSEHVPTDGSNHPGHEGAKVDSPASPAIASSDAGSTSAAPASAAPALATATTQAPPAPAFGEHTGPAGAVGGTVLALLLVVGVILALAWLAKRLPGVAGSGNPALKIVGSLALGPRERVVVVAVGDTQLLLSTGPHGTRALHTLEQPLPVATATSSPFAQVLAQQLGRKKP